MRLRFVLAAAALLGAGTAVVPNVPAQGHAGGSFCEGTYDNTPSGSVRPDGTRLGHGEGKCTTGFQGFPAGGIGIYESGDTADPPTAPASIHVEAYAVSATGSRYKLGECEASGVGVATCEFERSDIGGPLTLPEPLPQPIVRVECASHTHARVKDGTAPTARFGCYTTDEAEAALRADMGLPPAGGEDPPGDPGPGSGGLPVGQVITAVPQDRYAPPTLLVSRTASLTFANFDANRHDVVARTRDAHGTLRPDHVRPDGSAPWCDAGGFAGDCPLFWSELIPGPGTTTAVLGLEDAASGASYEFTCSIHPHMVGTLTVTD